MADHPHFTDLITSLPSTVPFVGPEAQERQSGHCFRARLGANENGFGPSPCAIAAMQASASDMWMYGDPENHDLRQSIAAHHGVQPENIAIGEGIDGLLGLIVRLYISPGAPVVTSLGGYPTFNFHVTGHGGQLVTVPYDGIRENLAGLSEQIRKIRPPLAYIANPDNPMASWWDAADIIRFMDDLPDETMLILDEAYCEFAPASAIPALLPLRPNVLRMRTFSKAYGLAGLRCGYAIGLPETIKAFDKIRNHFGISRMVQAAIPEALADQEHLHMVLKNVFRARQRIASIVEVHGLIAQPSATNFVAIDCGGDGAFATRLLEEMVRRGIFIRKPTTPGLDQHIRVSVGPDEALDLFERALAPALTAVRMAPSTISPKYSYKKSPA